MKLMSKVGTNKGVSSRLLAAALVVGVMTGADQVQAEASKVNFVAPSSSSFANDRGLMAAERDLLHSLAANSSETHDTRAELKASPGGPSKGASVREERSAPAPKSNETSNAVRVVKDVKAPAVKAVAEAKGPPAELVEKVRSLEGTNASMRGELQSARERIAVLEQQLDESRSQLAIAETEVSRLSGVLDSKTRASLGKYNLPVPAAAAAKPAVAQQAPRAVPARAAQPSVDVRPPSADADLQVATVAVEKADLRLGPGKNHSALMSLRRGSRLMVEARQGEWYRVFAPNGDRAWIAASLVSFGDGSSALNDGSSVRIKGFTASAEEEVFRRVHRSGN
jgi:hypothetical protein